MKISEFRIEVPAKWVLSGEHSVLRGKRAIAFPYFEFKLQLSYTGQASLERSKNATLQITPNPFQSQIRSLVGRAFEWLKIREGLDLTGDLDIQSNIPIGAGLGSSAALCVAIARFVLWKTNSDLKNWVALATHLEDMFHGKSSGMDVCVIAHAKPILYVKDRETGNFKAEVLLETTRRPRFELYDSGKRGRTRECIEKVHHWQNENPHLVNQYDEQMGAATALAEIALHEYAAQPKTAEAKLATAMNDAQNCFETWGLVSSELIEQKHELLRQGALAVKMTGSGLGGFWVALWPQLDKINPNPIILSI